MNDLLQELEGITEEQLLRLSPEHQAEIYALVTEAEHDKLDARCSQLAVDEVGGHLVAREDAGCLYWVQNLTLTENDHWLATPPNLA